MKRFRDPQWFLILIFLGIIAVVPLIQALREIRGEEDLRVLGVFSQPPTAANLRAYERSLESANWAANASRPVVQFAQFAWLKDGGEKALLAEDGWYFYKPGLQYMLARPKKVTPDTGTNDPVSAIVDFRDQLAARGIQLVLMPAPNKESVYPDRLTSRSGSPRRLLAPATRDILDKLRAANVEVIDLFQEFAQARQQTTAADESALYLAQDTHWSPAGVNLATKVAARRLQELGLVELGQTNYTERPAQVRRLGDILRMMQSPLIEREVAPETIPCMQVVQEDTGGLYADAPTAKVLVLGDSFMRIFQQDEPKSAGFIAHLAKELKQPLLSLVNDGGGSTLVRQELADRAPLLNNIKVVLWEFVERDIGLGLQGWRLVQLPPPLEPQGSTNTPSAGN